MVKKQLNKIALDADGVLIDYNLAAAHVWHKAFGSMPQVKDPTAYHFRNAYCIDILQGKEKEHYNAHFEKAWACMPAMQGAVQGCKMLHEAGYELHVVTAMPPKYAQMRRDNLRALGFPIASVTATGGANTLGNPKKETLLSMKPIAFVDDLLSNFQGVNHSMHCALLHWNSPDNPNPDYHQPLKASSHLNMVEFAQFWIEQDTQLKQA